MKQFLLAITMIFSVLVSICAQEQETAKGVAILKTVDEVGDVKPGVKLNLRATLAYAINHMPGYEAYTRVNLSGIMDEHKFQRSGFVDDNQIKQIGKATGAQYILIAEVAYFDEQHITVTASIIDIESTRIQNSSDPVISPVDPDGMRESCIKIARSLLGVDNISNSNTEFPVIGNPPNGKEWKTGYINSHDIIQVMPDYSKANIEIQALSNQYESELKSLQEQLQTKTEDYTRNQATLSDDVKQRRELELQELYQRLEQYYQTSQQSLEQAKQMKMEAITNKVKATIRQYGTEMNLLYVFDTSGTESSLIINKELNNDLTENIKYRLGISKTNSTVSPNKTLNRIGLIRSDEILSLMNITAYSDSATRQNAITRIVKATGQAASRYGLSLVVDSQSGIPFINDSFVCDITTIIENELNLTNGTPVFPNKFINKAKFAHINSSEIILNMPEYNTAQTEIQNLAKRYEDELKKMQDELNTKIYDFDNNKGTMSETVKQRREQELQNLNSRLQQYYQTSQDELNKANDTKMRAIQTKVLNAVKAIGKERGYAFIMDTTSGIPYISNILSVDVTAQVKKKLSIIY